MTFRIGQKVVCVDDSDSWLGPTSVRKGVIYTVLHVYISSSHDLALKLEEVKPARATDGFYASRFRPIVERKTDISVFTEILRKATKKIPALIGNERT